MCDQIPNYARTPHVLFTHIAYFIHYPQSVILFLIPESLFKKWHFGNFTIRVRRIRIYNSATIVA